MPALFTHARLTGSPSSLQLMTAPTVCLRCRLSYLAVKRPIISRQRISLAINNIKSESTKCLSTTPESRDGISDHKLSPSQAQDSILTENKGETTRSTSPKGLDNNSSFGEIDRNSNIQKSFYRFLEKLIAKATIAGHRINIITGTDYSSIELLRKKIKDQETFVTLQNAVVHKAREAVDVAHTQQAVSQKEVVGLLERKSSWSAADLERYMALIRSEHSNELAVQAAKEGLKEAERALEEARSKLEKKERAQYHEEQIWSDTIRRNSTWVTIGLMGVNILILLSSVIVIEPWRRKNMVKEMRAALDQHNEQQRLEIANTEASVNAFDKQSAAENNNKLAESDLPREEVTMLMSSNTVAEKSANSVGSFQAPEPLSGEPETRLKKSHSSLQHSLGTSSPIAKVINYCETFIRNAFSSHYISIRQNEVTRATLQGASVGAALAVILFSVFRAS